MGVSEALEIVFQQTSIFLLLGLACSLLYEMLEMILNHRGRDLERGIRELIGDPTNRTKCIDAIYKHGLVNSLFSGTYPPKRKRDLPSYIPAHNFALAVIDIAKHLPEDETLPSNLLDALRTATIEAGGDFTKFCNSLKSWFENGMDRVTDRYKRRTQRMIILIGLIVVVGLNINVINIARARENDSFLRQMIKSRADSCEKERQLRLSLPAAPIAAKTEPDAAGQLPRDMSQLMQAQVQDCYAGIDEIDLPFGWRSPRAGEFNLSIIDFLKFIPYAIKMHWLGWIVTDLLISLSAAPLFDFLNKFLNLRSVVKPARFEPVQGV